MIVSFRIGVFSRREKKKPDGTAGPVMPNTVRQSSGEGGGVRAGH
ncbi:MAG: hypothetical protein WA989_15740 [Henriciella sp.]